MSELRVTIGQLLKTIFDGDAYFYSRLHNLLNNGVLDIRINITSVQAAVALNLQYAGDTSIELYEGTTFNVGGDVQTLFNMKRSSANTSTVTVTTDAVVNALGTLMSELFANGGTKNQALPGGGTTTGPILKTSTDYLLRLTNLSGNPVTYTVGLDIAEGLV